MLCPSCNTETGSNSTFCPHCGANTVTGAAAAAAIPAQQGGLSETAAGAIAYVTIIPAIIFLAMEPYNHSSFVRFHSWQSIFLGVAAIALNLILGIIPIIGWLLMVPVGLGFLILWLVAIVKASKGERFKIPLIGNFAEQQAR
jgi:uncharacterized membrane protein